MIIPEWMNRHGLYSFSPKRSISFAFYDTINPRNGWEKFGTGIVPMKARYCTRNGTISHVKMLK